MDELQCDVGKVVKCECEKFRKEGGFLGSLVGKLTSKLLPVLIKHAPKIIRTLRLAAASGAISGATEKKTSGERNYIPEKMGYREYGLTLTESQRRKLGMSKGTPVTIRLRPNQLSGNDKLMLTESQIKRIEKGKGMDLILSATQMKKQGGFVGAILAGLAAPLIGKVLGFGQGKGLVLPGTGKGLVLPGTGSGIKIKKFQPLTKFNITKLLKNIRTFRGVYCKDLMPHNPKKGESMVVNLQDSSDGNGTHWVAMVYGKDYQYFDPFGIYPPDVITDYMKKGNGGVIYKSCKIQQLDSVMCGYYCCYYILERASGRNRNDILLDCDQESRKNKDKIYGKKQTESRNLQHILTKNGKHMMNGLCNICGRKIHNLSAKNQ